MGAPKAPKPPDPVQTAAAQTSSNIGTAIANQYLQPNQSTPWGSQSMAQTGTTSWTDPTSGKVYDIPQFTSTTTLAPGQQKLFNTQTANNQSMANIASQQGQRLGSILGQPLNAPGLKAVGAPPGMARVMGTPNLQERFEGAGAITKSYGADDFSADRRRVEEALMSRMNPALDRERERLTAQLSNQGIKLGTEAFDRAMAQHGERANDAQMQAILAGGDEQSRLTGLEAAQAAFQNAAQQQQYGQNLGRADFSNNAMQQEFTNRLDRNAFNNNARQQEFSNQIAGQAFNNNVAQQGFGNQQALRSGALNEQSALMSGGQVGMPQFAPMQGQQMPGIDMGGLINNQYQGQFANWQNQLNNRNQMMGGLFSAGTAMLPLMLSDERTKENVEPVGAEFAGNPVYEYNYIGDPSTRHVGVMAQDVKKTHPEAVVPMGRFLGVNYGKLAAVA